MKIENFPTQFYVVGPEKKKTKEPLYNFPSKFEQSESVHIKHSHEFK